MGKLETALRAEITRLSRREARNLTAKHAEELKKLRWRVIALERELKALKSARTEEQIKRKMKNAAQTVASEETPAARLSPQLIRSLRRRLNISQADLARLIGVSTVAVGTWESGRSKPRPEAKAKVVALRSLGRREVKRLLAEQRR